MTLKCSKKEESSLFSALIDKCLTLHDVIVVVKINKEYLEGD